MNMLAVVVSTLLIVSNASIQNNANSNADAQLADASAETNTETSALHNLLTMLQAEFQTVAAKQKHDDTATPSDEAELAQALAEADAAAPLPAGHDPVFAKAAVAAFHAVAPKAPEVKPHLRSGALKDDIMLKNGKSMTHKDFNAAIADLFKIGSLGLSKAELEATPFGGSVKKIRELIEDDMMPKVKEASHMDQHELEVLYHELDHCHDAKNTQWSVAKPKHDDYQSWVPKHTTCRQTEAGLHQEKIDCWEDEADKAKVMSLKCTQFAMTEAQYSSQKNNKEIVTKGGSEAAETYIKRLSATICGATGGAGIGGYGEGGFLDEFEKAKAECQRVTLEHANQKKKCQGADLGYANKKQECDNLQDQMDNSACDYAIDIKDSCEEYFECYNSRYDAYATANETVHINEADRKAEWVSLRRMGCLVNAFMDGKVENEEIQTCRERNFTVDHLDIDYPEIKPMDECEVPKEYPSTPQYKEAQFAALPELAKGKVDANECTGVEEISTTPAEGSPEGCACERLTLNGPYSPGPMVKCVGCNDIRRTQDKSSCPDGTKLFSPRSRQDWKTFIASAVPLRAPHFVIDITREENGCGGCDKQAMNSGNGEQKSWVTQDASPWWLRSTLTPGSEFGFGTPNGDYHANCYMDLFPSHSEDEITFNDKNCDYHSNSYYCQLIEVSTTPKMGSPLGCLCEKVDVTGHWSPKTLMKCVGCLEVSKSTQKNSCPMGTKLFAPATREDWKSFLASAEPIRAPNFIIDITRPQNGCGGCGPNPMNSDNAEQATWKTSDGAPWWLRSTSYFQPSADYEANCYMDVWGGKTENAINFGAKKCENSASAYYCQLAAKR